MEREVIIMNLKLLVVDFKDLDNRFGDVAKDILSDKSFPNKINSEKDLPGAFRANEACMNVYYYFALEEGLLSFDN